MATARVSLGVPKRTKPSATILLHAPSMLVRSRRCRSGSSQNQRRATRTDSTRRALSMPTGVATAWQAAAQHSSTPPEESRSGSSRSTRRVFMPSPRPRRPSRPGGSSRFYGLLGGRGEGRQLGAAHRAEVAPATDAQLFRLLEVGLFGDVALGVFQVGLHGAHGEPDVLAHAIEAHLVPRMRVDRAL